MSLNTLALVAAAALLISFAALVSGWRESRFPGATAGRVLLDLGSVIGRGSLILGRIFGTVLVGLAVASCFVVADDTVVNIAPRIVFVALWIFIPVGSAFLGDLWRWMSPFEALADVRGLRLSEDSDNDWSLYPAAALLCGFLWLELAYHRPAGRTPLAVMLIIWSAWSGIGALVKGRGWLRSHDPLAVFCRLVAAISPTHVQDGHLYVRRPLVGLGKIHPQVGLSAGGGGGGWGGFFFGLFRTGGGGGGGGADFEDGFALSLVPVAVGYAIAHYIGMGVFEGQQLLIQISDPFDRGWNLFGTADEYVNYRLIGPTVIAVVQALGIIGGHVAGVMVGHDRALATLRRKEDLSGQVPLVLLLASLTAIALILLVEA